MGNDNIGHNGLTLRMGSNTSDLTARIFPTVSHHKKFYLMPFFASKKFNPVDLIDDLVSNLNAVQSAPEDRETEKPKKGDKSGGLERNLRILLTKLNESDHTGEGAAQLCHEIYNRNVIILLIRSLPNMGLENRKDTVEVINYLVHRQVGVRKPTVDYIVANKEQTISQLVDLYPNTGSTLHVGLLLRDFAKIPELCQVVLESDLIYKIIDLLNHNIFDVAADSFLTLREFLSLNKKLSAVFLEEQFEKFFKTLETLINSNSYVTVRQSLKLLSELIMEADNSKIMTRYVTSADNLKLIMQLLTSKSGNIQFEAFHIFKVFVANPEKPQSIVSILVRNRQKLIEFLLNFQPIKEATSDEQFDMEIKYVINCIEQLHSPK